MHTFDAVDGVDKSRTRKFWLPQRSADQCGVLKHKDQSMGWVAGRCTRIASIVQECFNCQSKLPLRKLD